MHCIVSKIAEEEVDTVDMEDALSFVVVGNLAMLFTLLRFPLEEVWMILLVWVISVRICVVLEVCTSHIYSTFGTLLSCLISKHHQNGFLHSNYIAP